MTESHPVSLTVEDLRFELRRSSKRKTVGVTIDRDGRLILTAPDGCPVDLIERVAREKRFWVYTKLAQRELLCRPAPPREYVSGEGFPYLGRSYRLLLVDPPPDGAAAVPPLRLHHGRFQLRRDERHRAQEHFAAWYVGHGTPWLRRRVDLLAGRVGVTPPPLTVRELGYRWGACGADGSLAFHWRTVCLPPRIVEYVVAHELVHLHEPHHGPAFWRRLERAMPDFAARKRWLAEYGATF